jgi:hypothetical protein
MLHISVLPACIILTEPLWLEQDNLQYVCVPLIFLGVVSVTYVGGV